MANAKQRPEPSKGAIGEVELDRLLLNAVRRAIEPDRRPTLNQLPMATNDNQLACRSYHFRRAGTAPKLGRPSAIGPP
jgi:hypothetical protein